MEMTDHFSGLCETLTRIAAAPNPGVVWAAVKEFAARFGYTSLMVAEAPNGKSTLHEAVAYVEVRKQNLVEFDKSQIYANHPIVIRAQQTQAPFTIAEVKADPQFPSKLWIEQLPKVIREGDGIVVPVYRENELWAGLAFGGEAPDTTPLVRSSLHVVSHAAIERFVALRDAKSPPLPIMLSVRETQCLSYIATGNEDDEISRLLGISPRTVRFHVDSAKTKLGVTSRVQAVTKALRERLISV